MNNADLIRKFYESFANGDADEMVNCYDPDIVFHDPAFGELRGNDAKKMWRMLLARSKGEIKITFGNIQADEKTGSANWRAEYIFTQTGRKVINEITARFEFEDGRLIKHSDHFSMWKWSSQALGWKGYLLGWTGSMKKQIQKQTNTLLKKYTIN